MAKRVINGFSGSEENSPYEVLAVAAKCRLLEKPRDEFVIFNVVHILLLQCSLSAAKTEREFCVRVARPESLVVAILVHHFVLLARVLFFKAKKNNKFA